MRNSSENEKALTDGDDEAGEDLVLGGYELSYPDPLEGPHAHAEGRHVEDHG
jgi:hypothetical protein